MSRMRRRAMTSGGVLGDEAWALFVDHGPGFVSEDTASVMARLRIRLIHGTPAYPEGHGKVERFHRTEFEQLLRLLDGVHFWVPVEQAQELLELGAMEPLDLAASLRVGGCAMNEPDAQARHDRGGVLGDEAWAVVHEQGPEEAVTLDKPVQAVEEKAGYSRRCRRSPPGPCAWHRRGSAAPLAGRRLTPARKCLPSQRTISMRLGYENRRMSRSNRR